MTNDNCNPSHLSARLARIRVGVSSVRVTIRVRVTTRVRVRVRNRDWSTCSSGVATIGRPADSPKDVEKSLSPEESSAIENCHPRTARFNAPAKATAMLYI